MIDFGKPPCIYWSNVTKISFLQRRVLIYSIMYYELDRPILTDEQYDGISKQLVRMMSETPKDELKKTEYWYCMNDFDGTTGFDLYGRLSPEDQHCLLEIANVVLGVNEISANK